jgi:protein-disulfide isomerase/uncharacterized membrane protein
VNQERSIIKNGTVNTHIVLIVLTLLTTGITIYLTKHFFDVRFPTGLGGASLCDINSFLNCDAATHSNISNIFGVPIALFGLLISIFVLSNYIFKSLKIEGSLYNILAANLVGCIILFIYSIVVLGSLCPFCTVYYILSTALFLVFHFKSSKRSLDIKTMLSFGAVTLIVSIIFINIYNNKNSQSSKIATSLIKDYNSYENLGNPKPDSPYRIATSTEKFDDAPIQLTIFSDFQCPACKYLSSSMHALERKYKGKINIQYFFYPLDSNCNDKMTRPLHPLACKAAYLASCLPKKFSTVHDDIFENQSKLSLKWIKDYAEKNNVTKCFRSEDAKKTVVSLLKQGEEFNIQSTPTMLLNGVKVEGALPLNQMYILMDHLIKQHEPKI